MRKVLLFSVFSVLVTVCVAQQKFNVQNGTKTEFYSSLDSAVYYAAKGDTIYLPGMYISLNEELVIDKKVTLIGTGWDIDSIGGTQNTIIDKDIRFKSGTDGSLITGCNLQNINIPEVTANITIWRNKINGDVILNQAATNIAIMENWINGNKCIIGNEAMNCIIANNVINGYSYPVTTLKNSVISNNILSSRYDNNFFSNFNGCIIENNYINGGIYSVTYSYFKNNAFCGAISNFGNNTNTNNLFEQTVENTFKTSDWSSHPKYLTIKDNSLCKNAGLDSTDIGIYGGSTPFKSGSVPFNPHINKASISTQTDSNGMLKVNITVSAQNK